jgi:Plasmid encoded RepA protein
MDNSAEPPAGLTRLQRRLIDAAADLMEGNGDSPEYMHSVLCHVGMPRSQTDARTFERSSGNASIMIEAGRLWKRKQWHDQPLPYGAKPRLVLIHLCSEAVRTGSPEIEVGRSAREFLARLGLDNSGHEYARFRAQMEALAASRMVLGFSSENRDVTISTNPISRFEAWTQHDSKSLGLWPGMMTLSGEFYATLQEHAVPLAPLAIHALQKSALALDVYTWLAHRLCRVRTDNGTKLYWKNLRDQFGQEYKDPKNFKQEFKAALVKVCAVYPDANVREEMGGIRLYPSAPPIPKTQVIVQRLAAPR